MEGAYCSVVNCCEFLPCPTHQESKQDVTPRDYLTLMKQVALLSRKICREFHSKSLEIKKKEHIDKYSAEGQALLPPLLQQVFKQIDDLALFKADKFKPFDNQSGHPQGLKNKSLAGLIQAAKIAQRPFESVLRNVLRVANLLPDDLILGPIKKEERLKEKIDELKKENKHSCAIFDVNRAIIVCEERDDFVCTRTALYSLFGTIVQLKNRMSLAKGKLCSNAPCLLFQLGMKRESCPALSELLEEGKEWVVEVQLMTLNLAMLYHHSHVFYAIARGEALPSKCVKCQNPKGAIDDNKEPLGPHLESLNAADHRWDIALMRASPLISNVVTSGTFESSYELANLRQALAKRNRQVRVKSAIATLEELHDVTHQGALILHLVCPFDASTRHPILENELGYGVLSKVLNPIEVHMQRRPPKLVFLVGCWSDDLAIKLAKDIPYVCRISQFESLEKCSKFSSCVCKLLCDGETIDMAFECARQEYDTQQFELLGRGDRSRSIISPSPGLIQVDDGKRPEENISCLITSAVGRNADLSCLVQLLALIASSNYSKAAILTGPRLIGKSHLVKALSKFVTERSKQIHQYDGVFYVDKKLILQATFEAEIAFVMFGAKVNNLVDAIANSGKLFLLFLDEVDEKDNDLIRSILSTYHVALFLVVPHPWQFRGFSFVTYAVSLLEDSVSVQRFWSESLKSLGHKDFDEKVGGSQPQPWKILRAFCQHHPGKLMWVKELLRKVSLEQLTETSLIDLEAQFQQGPLRLTNVSCSVSASTNISLPLYLDVSLTTHYALDIFGHLASLEHNNQTQRMISEMIVYAPCTASCGCAILGSSHVKFLPQNIEQRPSTPDDVHATGLFVCGYLFDISLPNPRHHLELIKQSHTTDALFLEFLDTVLQREFKSFAAALSVLDRRVQQVICQPILNGPSLSQINISGVWQLLRNVVQSISPGAWIRKYLSKPGSLVLRFVVMVTTPVELGYICGCLADMMAHPRSALRRSQLLGPFLNEFSYVEPKLVFGLLPQRSVERALSRAARGGQLSDIQSLLCLHPALVDQSDGYGRTALLHAVSNGHLETVRWLLNRFPASIYDKDAEDRSVFDYALNHEFNLVKLLLLHDCNVASKRNELDVQDLYFENIEADVDLETAVGSDSQASITAEQQWEKICLELKLDPCPLSDFRALASTDLEALLSDVSVMKRGELRRLHKGTESPNIPKDSATVAPSLIFASGLVRILDSELTLEEEIGRGSFSTVYRGVWTRTVQVGKGGLRMQPVAVKIPHGGQSPMDLMREIVALNSLPHQNLLQLYGVCESSPLKLVMECMTYDLANVLRDNVKKQQILGTRYQKIRILKNIASALAHLHAQGVVHRDVKPSNVLLSEEQTKLCDLSSSKDLKQTVQMMTTVGTVAYMAPEMQFGNPVGKPADVWSFGIVMYEMFVGRMPGSDPVAEMRACGCLRYLCDMFAQCHSFSPTERPTMAELETGLTRLLMAEMEDYENMRAELRTAMVQDLSTYNRVWEKYVSQAEMTDVLLQVQTMAQGNFKDLRQPASVTNYHSLVSAAERVAAGFHVALRTVVERCGGRYFEAPLKSERNVLRKAEEEYGGDFRRVLDLVRSTGMFYGAGDLGRCISELGSGGEWQLGKVKDRLCYPLASGYRDVLTNLVHRETEFVAEFILIFEDIAQIKSQSYAIYKMIRVMKLPVDSD